MKIKNPLIKKRSYLEAFGHNIDKHVSFFIKDFINTSEEKTEILSKISHLSLEKDDFVNNEQYKYETILIYIFSKILTKLNIHMKYFFSFIIQAENIKIKKQGKKILNLIIMLQILIKIHSAENF